MVSLKKQLNGWIPWSYMLPSTRNWILALGDPTVPGWRVELWRQDGEYNLDITNTSGVVCCETRTHSALGLGESLG